MSEKITGERIRSETNDEPGEEEEDPGRRGSMRTWSSDEKGWTHGDFRNSRLTVMKPVMFFNNKKRILFNCSNK